MTSERAERRVSYTGAEPTNTVRTRIRHRNRRSDDSVAEVVSDRGSMDDAETEDEAISTENPLLANEESRWANYESEWPEAVVANLRARVWYPKGFITSSLDSLESRLDYRQAWVIGLKGCRCMMSHERLFRRRRQLLKKAEIHNVPKTAPVAAKDDPMSELSMYSVFTKFDGTDLETLVRIFLPPDHKERFIVTAAQLWNAYFNLTLGTIRVPSPDKQFWELKFVPIAFMEALIICLW